MLWRRTMTICIAIACLALCPANAQSEEFHVAIDGVDTPDRDGRSPAAAWASLAYACQQVPEGPHTIQIGPGTFTADRPARPHSGVTIAGSGATGNHATVLRPAADWSAPPPREDDDHGDGYLISLYAPRQKLDGITIRDLALHGDPAHRINGAIFLRDANHVALFNLDIRQFRWAGMRLMFAHHLDVHHNTLHNASTDKFGFHGGLIYTRWIKQSRLHHNRITSDTGGGYGYKGGGHEDVRIDHNRFDVAGGFSIESAHENEYGVQIDHNIATGCFSIPKPGQSDDPNKRGFEYTFWIHHNLLSDSYTIEGPRNHLIFEHNFVNIAKPGGRVYTHHGGINHGPIEIRHNVIVNCDRAFVWMNEGLAENIHVYNNTVFCADAGDRAGKLIGAYRGDRLAGWIVRNNVFVAPASQPRRLYQPERGVAEKITLDHNLLVNVTGAPDGNFTAESPGLNMSGEKPWPYYAPAAADSPVVDRGADGSSFAGDAPNLGAYEWTVSEPFPLVGPEATD
ncbi:hypothetical protein HED60_00545 [Planctomycetales bacterium ZRK34]|nr:hypothetical protein HED60_00545 [Planctomycetales bacterium ZRK34]